MPTTYTFADALRYGPEDMFLFVNPGSGGNKGKARGPGLGFLSFGLRQIRKHISCPAPASFLHFLQARCCIQIPAAALASEELGRD